MNARKPLPSLALSGMRRLERVVILGSGASAAVTEHTNRPFPTDANFLRRLSNQQDDCYLQPSIIELALGYLQGDRDDWDNQSFEEAWSLIDDSYNAAHAPLRPEIQTEFARLRGDAARREREHGRRCYYSVREGNLTSTELLINAGWECLQALLSLLGRVPPKADLDRFFRRLPFLKDKPARCAVISFNYDLVFETACSNANVHLTDYPLGGGGGGIFLIKPHGSVNWVQRIDAVRGATESIDRRSNAVLLDETGYEPPGREYLMQPMLVGLRPKHEHDECSPDGHVVDLFREIREACVTVLARAREVYVVGYRFPPADRYFRRVLMEARAARERPLAQVNYIGLGGDEGYWNTLIRHLFWVSSDADAAVDLTGF